MNKLVFERVIDNLPSLCECGMGITSDWKCRKNLKRDPKFLIQFIRAVEYFKNAAKCRIGRWHRVHDANVSRIIPILAWEFGIEFSLGSIIAALHYCHVPMEFLDPSDPVVGLNSNIFLDERNLIKETMESILQRSYKHSI